MRSRTRVYRRAEFAALPPPLCPVGRLPLKREIGRRRPLDPISPLEGEMSAEPTEGGKGGWLGILGGALLICPLGIFSPLGRRGKPPRKAKGPKRASGQYYQKTCHHFLPVP
ncbi:hypothetical protein QO002_001454 [Pararhizobium capsulatum DSM 1112]|uniref:Uncharacterized protein n=1 Tax=Pararhizobium capsulatum DSM 1112 TaxID=1121113 RepID=A0ABU0BM51_9HYPH|nr:hypothetical protein [Pararhizobium capsulatum DSM 1112]